MPYSINSSNFLLKAFHNFIIMVRNWLLKDNIVWFLFSCHEKSSFNPFYNKPDLLIFLNVPKHLALLSLEYIPSCDRFNSCLNHSFPQNQRNVYFKMSFKKYILKCIKLLKVLFNKYFKTVLRLHSGSVRKSSNLCSPVL